MVQLRTACAHYTRIHHYIHRAHKFAHTHTQPFRKLCEKWFIRVEQLINVTKQLRFTVYLFLGVFVLFAAGAPAMIPNYLAFYKLSSITAEDCVTNDVWLIGSIDTKLSYRIFQCSIIRSHLLVKVKFCAKSPIYA